MKNTLLSIATVAALLATGTILASDLCNVAEADRQPIENLQAQLESQGWEVRNMKIDDGCYEAYAVNAEGQRVEAHFDPATFEMVKSERD